ncbi:MAG: hypothetical protein R3335_14895 [Anaerolineales bacterium]|nr:hypothetical protein [Anaerolineales bacterium]
MALILILILGVALVILLTRPREVEGATRKASASSRSWADRASAWLTFSQPEEKKTPGFREYVAGDGAKHFPNDFKKWLAGLSGAEAKKFTAALSDYSKGLGYNLVELVEGGLDDRPSLLNSFVEAIVIYSQEYRKALKTREEEDSEGDEAPAPEEKKPAQKRASRRKAGAEGAA